MKFRDIPKDLCHGDYENDEKYRLKFQKYMNDLWVEKDKLFGQLQDELGGK